MKKNEKQVVEETKSEIVEEKKEILDEKIEDNNVDKIDLSKPQPKNNRVAIEKTTDTIEVFGASVEEKRKTLYVNFKKSKKLNNIIMIAVVILVMAALGLLILDKSWAKITGYCLAGCVLAGLLVYYIFTKNKFPNATKIYIKEVTKQIDEYVFNDEKYTDCSLDAQEKFQLAELNCDKVYKDVADIGSRNIIKGKFKHMPFICGELALYFIEKGKRGGQKKVTFLGKYISCENKLKFDGRYIIVCKTKDEIKGEFQDQPTDIEDLKILHDEDRIVIYGPEGKDIKSALPTKYISAIKNIKPNGPFMNFVAVIWEGHSAYYLSYDDPVITLPFEKPFEAINQDNLKNNIQDVLEANTLIAK